jgi:hypothetical protein
MSTTKIQPPRKLTEEEDLDSFEDWWFQVECYYSRDVKFSEGFDDKKLTWKERSEEHRGLASAEHATNLNTLLRALATYTSGPYVKNELLDDTRSLKDVRRIFLRFLEIEVTDHSLLNYYTITRRPSERPLVFYHRLRYHLLQHHLPEGTVISPTKTLGSDEVTSTTMERFIIMEWLHRLDIRLVKFVQEKFSAELSASSTYLLTMVDSLAKNVDKYITQMDNTSVNFLPGQGMNPSMHGAEDEEGNVLVNRGGYGNRRSFRGGFTGGRQQQPQQFQRSKFSSPFPRQPPPGPRQPRCQARSLDYNHDITNCPQLISKFSKVNLTEGQESDQEENENLEYEEFYSQNL